MYILIPTKITITGQLKGNLDPELGKVNTIRSLAEQLGLACDVKFGTAEIKGIDDTGVEFPPDAPAPEVTTIDEIEDVICVLGANGYIPSAKAVLAVHGVLDHQWMHDHLGYFKSLEPKLRDAIMSSWNPTGPSRPPRKEGAKLLGVSTTVMHERVRQGIKEVLQGFERQRQDYINALSPEQVIDEPVAILDVSVIHREMLRQAGLKTLRDICELTPDEFRVKLPERGWDAGFDKYYVDALQKWGLQFKTEPE